MTQTTATPTAKKSGCIKIAGGVAIALLALGGLAQCARGGDSASPTPAATAPTRATTAPATAAPIATRATATAPSAPAEHRAALARAESYNKHLHLSKQGLYDQLTSEYGGQFDHEAAMHAIENIDADWKANALERAKSYRDTLSLSKQGIYGQLVSEYGGKFTAEEAQYAIDHLDD